MPAGLTIGVDPAEDAARGLTVSPGGVTVVPKGFDLQQETPAGMLVETGR